MMRSMGSDPSLAGLVLDPTKCSKLSMEEKRALVYELSRWAEGAPELLQAWTRRELLEVLCVEMGKERKYTGMPKHKIIENLFKIVSEKKSGRTVRDMEIVSPLSNPPPPSKRQRKNAHPCRLPVGTSHLLDKQEKLANEDVHGPQLCQNIACRATMSPKDAFCKRCSCCICHKYDDNKDPSLWLACTSETPSQNDACGMSCHLECALMHEKTGIMKSENGARLDGSFYCVSCGKVNDLLRCWRKQLCIVKDARRVDILCYRVSLSHRLLKGTEKFKNLHELVDSAAKKLEAEIGGLDAPMNMARGIVNRLSSGAEVQRLCHAAVVLLDSMVSTASQLSDSLLNQSKLLSAPEPQPLLLKPVSGTNPIIISFEDVSPTSLSVVVGVKADEPFFKEMVSYSLWYGKADATDYPAEPVCKLVAPERKFLVSELQPATTYKFKVLAFGSFSNLGKWEGEVTTGSFLKDDEPDLGMNGGGALDLNSASPQSSGSDLSNHSEGYESNNTAACLDQGQLRKVPPDSSKKPAIPVEDACIGENNARTGDGEEDEAPDRSVSAAGVSHKIPTNIADLNQCLDVAELKDACRANLSMVMIPYGRPETVPPFTPSKLESLKGPGRGGGDPEPNSVGQNHLFPKPEKELQLSSSKKRSGARTEELGNKGGRSLEGDYEYCVKVVRWLECEGHIETSFRVKFLTWFSLRATLQERRVVSVFVDAMIDDPPSLAGQLIDTFSDGISGKPPAPPPGGFCTRLWH